MISYHKIVEFVIFGVGMFSVAAVWKSKNVPMKSKLRKSAFNLMKILLAMNVSFLLEETGSGKKYRPLSSRSEAWIVSDMCPSPSS